MDLLVAHWASVLYPMSYPTLSRLGIVPPALDYPRALSIIMWRVFDPKTKQILLNYSWGSARAFRATFDNIQNNPFII
jgi:hypothetical protein